MATHQDWSAELTDLVTGDLFFDDSTEGRRLGCLTTTTRKRPAPNGELVRAGQSSPDTSSSSTAAVLQREDREHRAGGRGRHHRPRHRGGAVLRRPRRTARRISAPDRVHAVARRAQLRWSPGRRRCCSSVRGWVDRQDQVSADELRRDRDLERCSATTDRVAAGGGNAAHRCGRGRCRSLRARRRPGGLGQRCRHRRAVGSVSSTRRRTRSSPGRSPSPTTAARRGATEHRRASATATTRAGAVCRLRRVVAVARAGDSDTGAATFDAPSRRGSAARPSGRERQQSAAVQPARVRRLYPPRQWRRRCAPPRLARASRQSGETSVADDTV